MQPSTPQTQIERGRRFQKLHAERKLFVLGNAWDVASALLLERAGFPAIGTTSLGVAAAHGLVDGENLSIDPSLETAARIARALTVPLSIDLEHGSDASRDEITEAIRRALATGAVGVNLEDGLAGSPPALIDAARQQRHIADARAAADASDVPFVINARTDVYWLKTAEGEAAYEETLRRADAYVAAGADCVFVPGAADEALLEKLVARIDAPLNVLLTKGVPKLATLREIGVTRVSLGSAPYRRAMAALRDSTRALLEHDEASDLLAGIAYSEINALPVRRS